MESFGGLALKKIVDFSDLRVSANIFAKRNGNNSEPEIYHIKNFADNWFRLAKNIFADPRFGEFERASAKRQLSANSST